MLMANAIERIAGCVLATKAAAMAPVGINNSVKAPTKPINTITVFWKDGTIQQNGSAAKKAYMVN